MNEKVLGELLRRASEALGDMRSELDGEAGPGNLETKLERAACKLLGQPVPVWAERLWYDAPDEWEVQ